MTEIIDLRYLPMKNNAFPPQTSMYFRILAGGYLVYLAWDIYKEMPAITLSSDTTTGTAEISVSGMTLSQNTVDIYIDDVTEYDVDIIDTWNMTIKPQGTYKGKFRVILGGKPYMAIRMRAKTEG